MLFSLSNYLTHPQVEEATVFDRLGNLFLRPFYSLFNRREVVVLRCDRHNQLAYISRPHLFTRYDTKEDYGRARFMAAATKLISIAGLPLAQMGFTLKAAGLLFSSKNRETLRNWEEPFCAPLVHWLPPADDFMHYEKVFDIAHEKELLPELIAEVKDHPVRYFVSLYAAGWNHEVVFPPFSECGCLSHAYNRLRTSRRQEVEQKIVDSARTTCPPESHPQMTYLSLGAGELLQELVIAGHLIELGYQKIELIFIERKYHNNTFDNFQKLFTEIAKQKSIAIQMSLYESMNEYVATSPDKRLDIASAIDFEDFTASNLPDFLSVQEQLSANGLFFMSAPMGELELTHDSVKSFMPIQRNWPEDIEEQIKKLGKEVEGELRVCLPARLGVNGKDLLCALQECTCKRISITFVKEDFFIFGDETEEKYQENICNIKKLLQLIAPQQAELEFIEKNTIEEILQSPDKDEPSYHFIAYRPFQIHSGTPKIAAALKERFPDALHDQDKWI